ncbi:hypothetical protein A946_04210 [Methylacidiphilum kamchatkense Kam1]|uniref:Uncharacterized protein n=1 Tax=Methylacidiphilum kamchatkense Kam1 TaxID=1202785 RepID=A0ABR4ZWU8_9BACT|nr:hypothetical protein A946_04210 [Methylacidiphilum kamchatkense Kam1]
MKPHSFLKLFKRKREKTESKKQTKASKGNRRNLIIFKQETRVQKKGKKLTELEKNKRKRGRMEYLS